MIWGPTTTQESASTALPPIEIYRVLRHDISRLEGWQVPSARLVRRAPRRHRTTGGRRAPDAFGAGRSVQDPGAAQLDSEVLRPARDTTGVLVGCLLYTSDAADDLLCV